VSFVVLLAGPGVRGDAILVRQLELILRAAGLSDEAVARSSTEQRQLIDLLLAGAAREALIAQYAKLVEAQTGASPAPDSPATAAGVDGLMTPSFRAFLTHDPQPVLRKLRIPVLALNGSLDLQVESKQNLPRIREDLAAAGNTDATVLELAGLNHLLQPAATGSPDEYATIETTLDPAALDAIRDWILERFGRKPGEGLPTER
jgi:hypothetical protein